MTMTMTTSNSMITATQLWKTRTFQSGTMIVSTDDPTDPWLYVFGPGGETDTMTHCNRFSCCEQIRNFLNGGLRPDWLDDLERIDSSTAESLDRTHISAAGPMIDAHPPCLKWVDAPGAKRKQKLLMDRLFQSGGVGDG